MSSYQYQTKQPTIKPQSSTHSCTHPTNQQSFKLVTNNERLPILQFIVIITDVPCNSSVGIESGDLPNESFHASSNKSGHYPYLGRLNNRIRTINETKRIWGAWCAEDLNKNQYIQVYAKKSKCTMHFRCNAWYHAYARKKIRSRSFEEKLGPREVRTWLLLKQGLCSKHRSSVCIF